MIQYSRFSLMGLPFKATLLATLVANASYAADLETLQINDQRTGEGFIESGTTAIGRGRVDAEEMPRTIQVINREIIDEIQPQAIEDIATLSANVVYLGNNDGRDNTFVVRGFQSNTIILDGFKFRDIISDPEIFNMQKVEILKGADSVLYGEADAGGLIAVTSKRPQAKPHAEVSLELTSFEGYSPQLDIGGPLNDSGNVQYRLVALYKNNPSWRDFDVDAERTFIAPSLTIDINDTSSLTLFAEYTDDEKPNDMGTAIDSDGNPVASLRRVNTSPDDVFVTDQTIVGFDYDYVISDNWEGRIAGRYLDGGYDFGDLWLPVAYVAPNYIRAPASQKTDYDEKIAQADFNGDINVAGMRHRISFGIDASNVETQTSGCFDPTSSNSINFDNPIYPPLPDDACDASVFPNTFDYTGDPTKVKRRGIFIEDSISLTDKLLLNAGVRYEEHKSTGGAPTDEDITLPKIGITYKLTPSTSLYAFYGESYTPATATDRNGNLLPAEEGEGYELGIKNQLLNGKLELNVALFDIDKVNVATSDPVFPLASIANGKQNSRGLEVSLQGQLTHAWNILANYGYLDTEDKAANKGKELLSAPRNTITLWNTVALTEQWSVGVGGQYVGSRFATADNSTKLPSYALLNANVAYKYNKQWKAQLNLYNITDENYIESAFGGLARSVHPGEPFSAVFKISYTPIY